MTRGPGVYLFSLRLPSGLPFSDLLRSERRSLILFKKNLKNHKASTNPTEYDGIDKFPKALCGDLSPLRRLCNDCESLRDTTSDNEYLRDFSCNSLRCLCLRLLEGLGK